MKSSIIFAFFSGCITVSIESMTPEAVSLGTILNDKHLIILKSLLQKDFITREVYEKVYASKVDFTVLIRQDLELEHRHLPVEVINQIITKLFTTAVTDDDVLLLKELVQLQVITPKIVQEVLVGKYDIFTVLSNVIVRNDIIDTIVLVDTVDPVDSTAPVVTIVPVLSTTTYVLNEMNVAILRDLVSEQLITADIFEAVLTQKIDLVTVLRQVLQRMGWSLYLINLVINRLSSSADSTETDTVILKELLKKNLLTPETFQAVIREDIDLVTVLHKIISNN